MPMRTATGLTVIAVGAILAFAVTTNTSVFNLHIAGWVLIVVGLVGILVPQKGYGWLRRRLVLRSGPRGPVISRVDETHYPRSIVRYPDSTPTEEEVPVARVWRPAGWRTMYDPLRRRGRTETIVRGPMAPGDTETIEEFSEE
jgi:hypothetical protein